MNGLLRVYSLISNTCLDNTLPQDFLYLPNATYIFILAPKVWGKYYNICSIVLGEKRQYFSSFLMTYYSFIIIGGNHWFFFLIITFFIILWSSGFVRFKTQPISKFLCSLSFLSTLFKEVGWLSPIWYRERWGQHPEDPSIWKCTGPDNIRKGDSHRKEWELPLRNCGIHSTVFKLFLFPFHNIPY